MQTTLLIFLLFLLTSTGHLAWLYHLMEIVPTGTADILTMVAGYLCQAAGIALFAIFLRKRPGKSWRPLFYAVLVLYDLSLVPALLGNAPEIAAVFGLVMSLFCGILAGAYLYELAGTVPEKKRPLSFGIGYGAATICSWFIASAGDGVLAGGTGALLLCVGLSCVAAWVVVRKAGGASTPVIEPVEMPGDPSTPVIEPVEMPGDPSTGSGSACGSGSASLHLCVAVIFLFSIINNIGFSFPASDIAGGISLELSRLFYAIGLVFAGYVTGKSRKYGAVCALATLILPFIMLALRNEPVPALIFWILGYFTFGFYSVFRIILFSDLSAERHLPVLSGLGLLVGRAGDALGTCIFLLLQEREVLLLILSAILFVAALFLFFRLYQMRYLPTDRPRSRQEIFNRFASQHDLSRREREVLLRLLDEKTNVQIAEELYVSESTVKYHIHNLLQKTGCKNRLELMGLYSGEQ